MARTLLALLPPQFPGDGISITLWDPSPLPPSSPKLLLLVQGVQEVVGHDVLPHQVVMDGSWKRGSSLSFPKPC